MSRVVLSGTYSDYPAKIVIDPNKTKSVLSTDFSCYHNVARNVTSVSGIAHVTCSGPVIIPTDGGWFRSQFPFEIEHLPHADVILGADWIAVSQVQVVDGVICRPSWTSLERLPAGHSWVPIPCNSSHGAHSFFLLVFQHIHGILIYFCHFQLKATQAGSLSVSDTTLSTASGSHECPINLDAVTDCLSNSNSLSYCFISDDIAMRKLMSTHGLHIENLDRMDWERTLCYHLLHGLCAGIPADGNLKRSACDDIAGSCSSVKQLELLIMDLFVNKLAPTMPLKSFRRLCASIEIEKSSFLRRKDLMVQLQTRYRTLQNTISNSSLLDIFRDFDHLRKPALMNMAVGHGLTIDSKWTIEDLRDAIITHVTRAECLTHPGAPSEHCQSVTDQFDGPSTASAIELQCQLLQSVSGKLTSSLLRRILQIHEIPFEKENSISQLRRRLRKYVHTLQKGKFTHFENPKEVDRHLQDIRDSWPHLVPNSLKEKIHRLFREETSSERLREFTCASCAQLRSVSEQVLQSPFEVDLNLLRCPDSVSNMGNSDSDVDSMVDATGDDLEKPWLDCDCTPPDLPFTEGPLRNLLLDPAGVHADVQKGLVLSMCRECLVSIKKGVLPPLSLANRLFIGQIPVELKDLTPVEESMIALCRAKSCIVQLKEENNSAVNPVNQRGFKGHIIIYPQRPERLASVLPPTIEDVITPICVIFVGSSPPTAKWLQEKAKPLSVRREKVRNALIWLQKHNTLYKNITIDQTRLDKLPFDAVLPFHIQHVLPNDAQDGLTSRYDNTTNLETDLTEPQVDMQVPFQNVVITDIDGHAPPNELRAAAVQHIKKKGGAYVQIPHDPEPVNEFANPKLFPCMYPTLFPYGIGGFEDDNRISKLSFKRQVKYFFNLADRRFQEHYSFLLTLFSGDKYFYTPVLKSKRKILHLLLPDLQQVLLRQFTV